MEKYKAFLKNRFLIQTRWDNIEHMLLDCYHCYDSIESGGYIEYSKLYFNEWKAVNLKDYIVGVEGYPMDVSLVLSNIQKVLREIDVLLESDKIIDTKKDYYRRRINPLLESIMSTLEALSIVLWRKP